MPNYIRAIQPGGTFFFTVVTYKRQHLLTRVDVLEALRESVMQVRQTKPFIIKAWVVMPDHMHFIWRLPDHESDYSRRWGLIKAGVSRRLNFSSAERSYSREARRESALWQRRFWEHRIRSEEEFRSYMDYLHYNPVKHNLVSTVARWPHSSFHEYVRRGIYRESWGAGIDLQAGVGE